MKLSQYKRRNWKKEPVKEHFRAVSEIYQKISKDRESKIQQGVPNECLNYDAELHLWQALWTAFHIHLICYLRYRPRQWHPQNLYYKIHSFQKRAGSGIA
jgi:hypothetical protein